MTVTLRTLVVILIALVLAGAGVVYSGAYNIGADENH